MVTPASSISVTPVTVVGSAHSMAQIQQGGDLAPLVLRRVACGGSDAEAGRQAHNGDPPDVRRVKDLIQGAAILRGPAEPGVSRVPLALENLGVHMIQDRGDCWTYSAPVESWTQCTGQAFR